MVYLREEEEGRALAYVASIFSKAEDRYSKDSEAQTEGTEVAVYFWHCGTCRADHPQRG